MAGQHFVVGTPETFENRMPVDPVEAYEARDLGWKDPRSHDPATLDQEQSTGGQETAASDRN